LQSNGFVRKAKGTAHIRVIAYQVNPALNSIGGSCGEFKLGADDLCIVGLEAVGDRLLVEQPVTETLNHRQQRSSHFGGLKQLGQDLRIELRRHAKFGRPRLVGCIDRNHRDIFRPHLRRGKGIKY
jgi:hypothetical protein